MRNKYCCICAHGRSKDGTAEIKDHVCYKNWSGSSTGIESDVIVEGFKKSVAMHNLKFHRLIGKLHVGNLFRPQNKPCIVMNT